MPRNKRGDIKLRHDQTVSALEKALGYQTELYKMFLEPHPTHAKGYEVICTLIVQTIDFVTEMKKHI